MHQFILLFCLFVMYTTYIRQNNMRSTQEFEIYSKIFAFMVHQKCKPNFNIVIPPPPYENVPHTIIFVIISHQNIIKIAKFTL